MEVRVLGCSGTYPTAESPSSGYLVTGSGSRVWIDAGTGTFAALQAVTDFTSIDAVVLTHVHFDHCIDLFPYYYALLFHPAEPRDIPIYAPTGTKEHFDRLSSSASFEDLTSVFSFHHVEPSDSVCVGDLVLEFARTDHPVPTLAVSVSGDGHRLVYSADTGPGGDLPNLAEGADSLVCEATYQDEHRGPPIHLTAAQAGAVARSAGVGSLFLTHVFPTLDRGRSAEEAAVAWGAAPTMLEAGMAFRTAGGAIERI